MIGKGGINIKLVSCLMEFEIDVYCNNDEIEIDDVELVEFVDEIEDWIIEELKNIGCDIVCSVLELSWEEIVCCIELEEEIVKELLEILVVEFEE